MPGRRINADVLMVPAADVLILTVLFIVLSGTLLYRPVIPVRLPESAAGEVASEDNPVVTLTPGGGIFLNGRKVSREGLSVILELSVKLALGKNREHTLIISADRDVPHSQLIEVIDIASEAGIGKIAIAVERDR